MQSEVRLWHNGSLYPSSLLALFLRIRLLSDVLDAPAGVADTARTSTLAKSITNFVGRMDIRPFTVGPFPMPGASATSLHPPFPRSAEGMRICDNPLMLCLNREIGSGGRSAASGIVDAWMS